MLQLRVFHVYCLPDWEFGLNESDVVPSLFPYGNATRHTLVMQRDSAF